MYHLYYTDAIVLGAAPSGEGSKTISLFTRELGLITATAQSVREERSKLRYGLQDFSYSHITLVRGKEYWRITGAECVEHLLSGSLEPERMIGRVCRLLRRLLAGEEKNEPLFCAVLEGLQFVKASSVPPFLKEVADRPEDLNPSPNQNSVLPLEKGESRVAAVEIVLVLRILHLLGYLAPRNEFDPFLSHAGLWDDDVVSKALLFRTLAISEINNSLKESQL